MQCRSRRRPHPRSSLRGLREKRRGSRERSPCIFHPLHCPLPSTVRRGALKSVDRQLTQRLEGPTGLRQSGDSDIALPGRPCTPQMSETQCHEVQPELIDRFEDRCASLADLSEAITISDRAGAFECCWGETLMRFDDIRWCRIANQPSQVEDMAESADRSSQSGSVW